MIKTIIVATTLTLVILPAVAEVRFFWDIDQGYNCEAGGR